MRTIRDHSDIVAHELKHTLCRELVLRPRCYGNRVNGEAMTLEQKLTSGMQVVDEVDIKVRHLARELLLNRGCLSKEQDQLRSMEYCAIILQHGFTGRDNPNNPPPSVGSCPGICSLKK